MLSILTGDTAKKIKAALDADPDLVSSGLTVVEEESFEGAVSSASRLGRAGGCVLLSPASASFDRFKNFAERGRYFAELVSKL